MIEEADLEEEEEKKAKAPNKTFTSMKTDFSIRNQQQSKQYAIRNKNANVGGKKKVTESQILKKGTNMLGQKKKQDLLPHAPPLQRTRLETLALPKARGAAADQN